MLISTIIRTFRRERLLAQAVQSVLRQEVPNVENEVIVVNDGGDPLSSAGWQNDERVSVFDILHT